MVTFGDPIDQDVAHHAVFQLLFLGLFNSSGGEGWILGTDSDRGALNHLGELPMIDLPSPQFRDFTDAFDFTRNAQVG